MASRTERPAMTPSRANVIRILSDYRALGYELTLLEVHKLLYFLQESGEPLKLRFAKGKYGPYADNLRHVLHRFEGHFTRGFGDGRNQPNTPIEVLPDAMVEAVRFMESQGAGAAESERRFGRVAELIEGFESPYGMELLSSVHWIATREQAAEPMSAVDIVNGVQGWNDRKRRMMKADHIRLAWEHLRSKGWIA